MATASAAFLRGGGAFVASEYIGILVTWLVAVLSRLSDARAADRGKRLAAWAVIVLSTGGTAYGVFAVYRHNHRKTIYTPPAATARAMQEASGGAIRGNRAYVVDDEVPSVLVFNADARHGFIYDKTVPLWENGKALTDAEIDDLEGIAADPRSEYLYLTASHSHNKDGHQKPARKWLVRGCISPDERRFLVLDRISLDQAFDEVIFQDGLAKRFTVVDRKRPDGIVDIGLEVEGLASDDKGNLYFGLRAPLATVNQNALIVRVPVGGVFEKDTPCQERPVPLAAGRPYEMSVLSVPFLVEGQRYGIVSLEFDAVSQDLVMLGNSPEPFGTLPPAICRWKPGTWSATDCALLPETVKPYWGKQEALLLGPGSDTVTILIDGDKGLGGSITYARSEIGLPVKVPATVQASGR